MGNTSTRNISARRTSVAPLVPSERTRLVPEQTPALKGARGEAWVFRVLEDKTPYTIRDVSHQTRFTDIMVDTPHGRIFIESKDYASTVPSREVLKFKQDLGSRGADAGVFISLSSGIAGFQKTLTTIFEVLPAEGRVIPVIYITSRNEDVITAAVDLAVYHVKTHSGTIEATTLHPQDSLKTYVAGQENLADLYEDIRADIRTLALATSNNFGGILEKFGPALCDHRRLIRLQRAAVEDVEDITIKDASASWDLFVTRYTPSEDVIPIIKKILKNLCGDRLGDIRGEAHWHLLKTKARHVSSRSTFSFLKSRTDFCKPLAVISGTRIVDLLTRHPKKVRITDEVLSLELNDDTASDAIELADI